MSNKIVFKGRNMIYKVNDTWEASVNGRSIPCTNRRSAIAVALGNPIVLVGSQLNQSKTF